MKLLQSGYLSPSTGDHPVSAFRYMTANSSYLSLTSTAINQPVRERCYLEASLNRELTVPRTNSCYQGSAALSAEPGLGSRQTASSEAIQLPGPGA